ncbi:MAG: ATP synthase A1 subunit C [Candidatus Thermoplasmatota archaeon]|nr:ATP synthase A1 subunit C [Candidatus Thermoplasmatota archaeon]
MSRISAMTGRGNYAYACARVKAKRAMLIPKEAYPRLLAMDVSGIMRFIGESQYSQETQELGIKYTGAETIELVLGKNLAKAHHGVLGFCKGELKELVSAYMRWWDVRNIKTVLRGKRYNAIPEDILKAIVPAGEYDEKYWAGIVRGSSTIEDVIENLKGTEYYGALVKTREKLGGDLSRYENGLEMEYYRRILDSIKPATNAKRTFIDFMRDEIDLVNFRTLFMTKFDGVEPKKIIGMLIPGGKMGKEDLHALANTDGFGQFMELLRNTAAYPAIKDEISQVESAGLNGVIRALEKAHAAAVERMSRLHPLSVLPVMNYITRKEAEIENLRIIVRGKASGLDTERIRELIMVM